MGPLYVETREQCYGKGVWHSPACSAGSFLFHIILHSLALYTGSFFADEIVDFFFFLSFFLSFFLISGCDSVCMCWSEVCLLFVLFSSSIFLFFTCVCVQCFPHFFAYEISTIISSFSSLRVCDCVYVPVCVFVCLCSVFSSM